MLAAVATVLKAAGLKSLLSTGAGLAVGVAGGAAVFALAGVSAQPTPQVGIESEGAALRACPGSGRVVGRLQAGEQILVTGRSAEGSWLEVYVTTPLGDRAWAPAAPLHLQGDVRLLPVSSCASTAAVPTASSGSALLSTPEPTSTLEPPPTTGPTSTPTSRPPPTDTPNTPPVVAGLQRSRDTISTATKYCPKNPQSVDISAKVTDPGDRLDVRLHWIAPSGAQGTKTMSRSGDRWGATLDTVADAIATAGKLSYWVDATDGGGLYDTTARTGLTVKACPNTGPNLAGITVSPTTVFADPWGIGTCATRATFKSTVTDVDGIASVTLQYRAPGEKAWRKRSMTAAGSTWSTSADLSAKVFLGKVTWRMLAVDKTKKSRPSGTRTIAVESCDQTPPKLGSLQAEPLQIYRCGGAPSGGSQYPGTIDFWVRATDPAGSGIDHTDLIVRAGGKQVAKFTRGKAALYTSFSMNAWQTMPDGIHLIPTGELTAEATAFDRAGLSTRSNTITFVIFEYCIPR